MRLFTKSAVAEQEKLAEEAGKDLAKSAQDVMDGLDAFIKANVGGKDETKEKDKEKQKTAEEEAALAKSIQAASEKKEKEAEDKSAKDNQTAEEMAKVLHAEQKTDQSETSLELDGDKVLLDFKKAIASMIAKAAVSIRESLIDHVDAKISEVRDGQVLVAKALLTNGKMLKEAMHEVAVIGDQPRGRKSVLTVMDKALSGGGGTEETRTAVLDPNKVMAKALVLNEQKKITPTDVGIINHHVVGGMGIPARYASLFVDADISTTQ